VDERRYRKACVERGRLDRTCDFGHPRVSPYADSHARRVRTRAKKSAGIRRRDVMSLTKRPEVGGVGEADRR
jgi:hypothetical protein